MACVHPGLRETEVSCHLDTVYKQCCFAGSFCLISPCLVAYVKS